MNIPVLMVAFDVDSVDAFDNLLDGAAVDVDGVGVIVGVSNGDGLTNSTHNKPRPPCRPGSQVSTKHYPSLND